MSRASNNTVKTGGGKEALQFPRDASQMPSLQLAAQEIKIKKLRVRYVLQESNRAVPTSKPHQLLKLCQNPTGHAQRTEACLDLNRSFGFRYLVLEAVYHTLQPALLPSHWVAKAQIPLPYPFVFMYFVLLAGPHTDEVRALPLRCLQHHSGRCTFWVSLMVHLLSLTQSHRDPSISGCSGCSPCTCLLSL